MSRQRLSMGGEGVAALVARYKPAVFAFLSRRLRDRGEAEDLTQEVFTALSKRAELESIRDAERYIFQIAANLLRDRGRRLRTQPQIDGEAVEDWGEHLVDEISPERLLIARETYALFLDLLQELPERARMIFMLNRFEEMTGREIAAMLGISQRQVEKDISRVLALLRERLP